MSKFVNQIYPPRPLTIFPFGASSLHLIFPFSVTTLRWCELVARTHFAKDNFPLCYDPYITFTFSVITFPLFRHSSFSRFSVILPPSAYGLRPSTSFSFFRLETSFSPFFASLYYTINQFFTHPFYTNRPRFV